jgi:Na+-transporting methylmalonyl-CoA/oxaloacetate decarboxylase gamma subunit
MANGTTDDKTSARWIYGLVAVGLGLVAIVASLLIVAIQFDKAADVGAVLGVVVAPIGTIVGAYFGVQAGSAGKETADKNAKEANDKAVALAAAAEPGAAQEALRALP